jgi:hypothetical protein
MNGGCRFWDQGEGDWLEAGAGCGVRRIPGIINTTLVKKRKAMQKEQPVLLLLHDCTCSLKYTP